MLLAARAQPYTAAAQVYTGRGLWCGYAIKNTHATAAGLVDFYDGASTSGVLIGTVAVAAGDSKTVFPTGATIRTESGLFLNPAGGTLTVVPYYLTQTRWLTGLAVTDDEDRNTDGYGAVRLLSWLEEHGMEVVFRADDENG